MRLWAAALAAVIGTSVMSGCMADPLPWPTVRDFLLAWQTGRYQDAAAQATGPDAEVAKALRKAKQQLDARDLQLRVDSIKANGNFATATFRARMWLDGVGRQWTYQGHMELRRRDGSWKVVWRPTVIHPKLDENTELAVVTSVPPPAPVLGSDGNPLVRATPVVTVGVQPGALKNRNRTTGVLARATGADRSRLSSLIKSSDPDAFVPVATLRRAAYRKVENQLGRIQGLRIKSGTMRLPPEPSYARALLGGVGAVSKQGSRQVDVASTPGEQVRLSGLQLEFRQRLSGTPGSKVVALEANGRKSAVLAELPGRESRPVHTTIDGDAQEAAERALSSVHKPAALVAVQASTGNVLAVANRPASSTYNRAFLGEYRPGSAFRLVASQALLSNGVEMSAPVPCPDRRIVGGEEFRNHQASLSVASDKPSFRQTFADACTTAFVGLSPKLPEGALRQAAGTLGIGGDWKLPLPVFTGSVPPPDNDSDKAAATIGEGAVRVSPLAMALAAGAVESGTWHPPALVTHPEQQPTTKPRSLPAESVEKLRSLMRVSVESGTASAADLPGRKVSGTAGTAYRPKGAPHAWFVGSRGDIAFAVLIEGGGSGSGAAAPLAAKFLRELPYRGVFDDNAHTR